MREIRLVRLPSNDDGLSKKIKKFIDLLINGKTKKIEPLNTTKLRSGPALVRDFMEEEIEEANQKI